MHPGMHWWWENVRRATAGDCYAAAGCGPSGAEAPWREPPPWLGAEAGPFGVRRPLRFLAYKLGLDDAQAREVARILEELKTERAQAAVDHRRMSAALADVLAADPFDAARAAAVSATRLHSAERLREATVRALERLHAVLRPEQRATLAMLVRTGVVVL